MNKDALVKNAADKEQLKEAAKKEKWSRDDELDDMRAVLNSTHGRRFLWRYLEKAHLFETCFTGNSQTFFKLGEQNIGLQMMSDIMEADEMAFVQMMKENKKG